MAIAIPSVTKYITQSRKKTLISTMDSYVTAVTTAVNDNEFGAMSKQDTMYYVPVSNDENNSCVSLEKGGTNPFGNWKQAYVVVNYDATNYSYDYYFTFFDDAGYGMELTKIEDIDAQGSMIKNPSTVNADNITTQLNDRATKVEVLVTGTCNISNTVSGGNTGSSDAPKVTTLAGTTWKFNSKISNYDFLDTFDYESQTGWDQFPTGCKLKNSITNYEFWGFSRINMFGVDCFSPIKPISTLVGFNYIPSNNIGIVEGWYAVTNDEYGRPFFNMGSVSLEAVLPYLEQTEAPTITFSAQSNSAIENTQLINWMYENATMQ